MPPSQALNNQFFTELDKKGMPKSDVNNIMRTGVDNAGNKIAPKQHQRFVEADNWKPGNAIPDDWADS